eukprot:m.1408411 g.1408411  ORF g.1408411 m.1408411 type:complete len:162 (+) comp25022_c1_seq15:3720-4205(+)
MCGVRARVLDVDVAAGTSWACDLEACHNGGVRMYTPHHLKLIPHTQIPCMKVRAPVDMQILSKRAGGQHPFTKSSQTRLRRGCPTKPRDGIYTTSIPGSKNDSNKNADVITREPARKRTAPSPYQAPAATGVCSRVHTPQSFRSWQSFAPAPIAHHHPRLE